MPNTVATLADIRSILIWIQVFGKLLVQKGVLTKPEIIQELNDVLQTPAASDPAVVSEVKNMIETVTKW